jgi:hypothetical protein
MIRFQSLVALFAVALICAAPTASQAATIISVSGQRGTAFTNGAATPVPSVEFGGPSWSQTQSYTNVTISESFNATRSGFTIDAYLMKGIVPQPMANQVAHSVTALNAGDASYTLFSGLTLTAGTYTLVVDSLTSQPNTVGGISTVDPPTILLDTGVTYPFANYGTFLSGGQPPYAPNASGYVAHPDGFPIFSVVGSAVPEPSSLIMVGTAGVLGVLGYGWRRILQTGPKRGRS